MPLRFLRLLQFDLTDVLDISLIVYTSQNIKVERHTYIILPCTID